MNAIMKVSMMNCKDNELLSVICDIMEIKSMRAAVDRSVQAGIAVGSLSALGGLLLGPRGLAIGGVLGGLGASYMMDGSFKSVPDIVKNDLTQLEKKKLLKSIRNLLTKEKIFNMAMLLLELSHNVVLIKSIVEIVKKYLTEFKYNV